MAVRLVRARSNFGLSPESWLLSCWCVSPEHKALQQRDPRAALLPRRELPFADRTLGMLAANLGQAFFCGAEAGGDPGALIRGGEKRPVLP